MSLYLIVRPADGAERTAAGLAAAGYDALVAPLLTIRRVAHRLPDGPFDALALTSAHGVGACGDLPRDLPAFAVGTATADALRAAGFTDVRPGGGTAPALAETLGRALPEGANVLYPRGRDVAHDLAALLSPAGLRVRQAVVYEAVGAEDMPGTVIARWDELDGVLLHSPRTARLFARASRGLRPLPAYCLSDAVAEAIRPWPASVAVAPEPRDEALRSLLEG